MTRQIRRANWANFDSVIRSFNLFRTVEENWMFVKNALFILINQYIPITSIKSASRTFWYSLKLHGLNNKKNVCSGKLPKKIIWILQRYKACDTKYEKIIRATCRLFYKHCLSIKLTTISGIVWRVIILNQIPDTVLPYQNGKAKTEADCSELLNQPFVSLFTRECLGPMAPITTRIVYSMPKT